MISMERQVTYCGDRLVKVIEQIDVSTPARTEYIDGTYRWFLDGDEITEPEASAFRIVWESDHRA